MKNPCLRRGSQLCIDNDPEGISAPNEAAGQLWIVLDDGARSNEDCILEAAQAVGETQRRRGTDPAGMAGGCSDPTVKGLGEFDGDEGDAGPDIFEEDLVQLPAGLCKNPDRRFDPVSLEGLNAFSGDLWIGIGCPDDDTAGTASDQGVDTGGCPAVMGAWFEGDIEGCPSDRFRRVFYRVDLGMVLTAAAVITFRYDPAVPDDDGADQGIRADAPFSLPGQPERQAHEALIRRTGFSFCHDLLITRTVGMATFFLTALS
jgi:hypothetical protein